MHSRSPRSGRADPAPSVPAQWPWWARSPGQPGCTLQSARRSWLSRAKRRWAGQRLAGRPARAAPQNPRHPGVGGAARPRRGAASEVRESRRGLGEARREGPSGPSRVPYPGRGEGPGRGHEGTDSQVIPGFEPKSLRTRTGAGVPAGCRGGAGRGASTLTSRSEGPAPLAALADADERAAARSAVPSPTDRRPARGRADGPRARRAPSRPAAAAPRSAPAGRGGERRRAASTRFPGRRASGPSPLQTSSRSGSGWVRREPSAQPRAARGSAPRLRLQTSPPLPLLHPLLLFLAPLFLGVLFMGCTSVMGVPDGKGMEATKPHAMPPCQPTPRLAGLCCSDANPDVE